MRGYLIVKEEKQKEYLDCFFDAYWKDDKDLSSIENISKLLSKLNINDYEFFKSIKKQFR